MVATSTDCGADLRMGIFRSIYPIGVSMASVRCLLSVIHTIRGELPPGRFVIGPGFNQMEPSALGETRELLPPVAYIYLGFRRCLRVHQREYLRGHFW